MIILVGWLVFWVDLPFGVIPVNYNDRNYINNNDYFILPTDERHEFARLSSGNRIETTTLLITSVVIMINILN